MLVLADADVLHFRLLGLNSFITLCIQAVEVYRVVRLRIPHCLDSRLTDGGEVSPTHRQDSTPEKHYFSASDNSFC
jgi:hypothetical protein